MPEKVSRVAFLRGVDDCDCDLYHGPLTLGQFHERLFQVEDVLGRLARKRVKV